MASRRKDKVDVNPQLQKLLKSLTESGLQELDRAKTAELLDLCRTRPTNVQETFRMLFSQLAKPHAEIRWSCFQLIVNLFDHFEAFRTCVVDRIKEFVHLVVQHDPDKPLPPPKVVAERLSDDACRTIAQWNRTYGQTFVQLELMYKFMQNVYKIKFEGPRTGRPVSVAPVNSRAAKVKELQLKKATEELTAKLTEISENLNEFWSCMKLLMPSPDNFDVPLGSGVGGSEVDSTSAVSSNYTDSSLREQGYRPGVAISIVLPKKATIMKIIENDDNATVLENLRACYSVCSKHQLPAVTGLLEKISKLGASEEVVKSAIDAKSKLTKAKNAFEAVKIKRRDSGDNESDDDVAEEDWIDVPPQKEGTSADNILQQRIEAESKPSETTLIAQEKNEIVDSKDQPTSTNIPTLLPDEIPADNVQADPALMYSKEDNIWCNSVDFDPETGKSAASSMLAEALSTRTYYFVSKESNQSGEIPVCGAPLGNGKFCPRRDKVKCPFHGPIGSNKQQPANTDSSKNLEDIPSTSTANWCDPSLERDISAALGVKLTAPVKSRKRSGLAQLKPDNPKTRIMKKMSVGAERVADDMNRQDVKRHNSRFAHSFNYSLSRTL